MRIARTRKFRGKNKAPKWTKPHNGIVSVIVLPLAVTDPADLARVEVFGAMGSLKRAVQRDARNKVDSGRVAVPRERRDTSAPRTAGQRNRATLDETRPVRDHAGKPGPERRAVHSSPLVNCGSSLRLGHRD
jgi:hypothetical protein